MNGVVCKNCCCEILEPLDLQPDQRLPCPDCGSRERLFSVSVEVIANVESTVPASVIPGVSLLLQAVVLAKARTNEGLLIEAVALPWFEIIELLKKDFSVAFQLSSRKWEELIAGAYVRAKFDDVVLTPSSGDGGRDVIAIKHGLGSIRIIDQVKAYNPKHLVNADDVRALMGVLSGDGASKGFLTTTSDFAPRIATDPLIAPFIPSRLELINGRKLIQRLEELSRNK